ncbi:MAG: porin family protein, partial [candidate division Zixibacteria bacterium]|nr:porin family protein [candidate division Zixibacteria bacterium]
LFSVYAGGALSLPMSPDGFKDNYKTGYHASLGLGYKVMPNMQLVGKFEYHTFKFNFEDGMDISGGTNKVMMFGADARYAFNIPAAPVSPYVIAGGGLASVKQSEFDTGDLLIAGFSDQAYEDQTKFYWNAGVGLSLKSGPAWSFFAQARYVNIATDGESSAFVPVSFGVKFF